MIFKNSKGFTLIELIAVIVILGILAVISVPKFLDLTSNSKDAQCNANMGAIHSAVALKYAETAATTTGNTTVAFPASYAVTTYYADGIIPVCPYGIPYNYNATTGRIATADHTVASHNAVAHG